MDPSLTTIRRDYRYICIEGNIGAGKTTLSTRLARQYNTKPILEQFTDNPFLPLFYQDPARYAFPVEIFFMTERYKQIQARLSQLGGLFDEHHFADYAFFKTQLFARVNLSDQEFRLFQQLFFALERSLPSPDLVLYLHRSPAKLLEMIAQRGRPMESQITKEYLQKLQNSYFEYFRYENTFPIVVVDVEEMDFSKNEDHRNALVELMSKEYHPGMYRISLNPG